MISRRDFLTIASAGVIAGTMFPRLHAAGVPGPKILGKAGMIVRSDRFLDLEMPPEFFNSWITPVPHFFVRNHMHQPGTWDAASWRLSIGGEVEKPLSVSLAELANWISTLSPTPWSAPEMAGPFNSRGFLECNGSGALWEPLASPVPACMISCSVRE